MWKKEEGQAGQSTVAPTGERVTSTPPPRQATGRAVIGPSIRIKGDVTGSEDLLIQGEVDGSVSLSEHAVGVGTEGKVKANIVGRLITIEGRVEGDLTAREQIVLRGSAHVMGDIKAPRVVLEDGATFRGLVDMGAAPPAHAERATKGKPEEKSSGNGSAIGGASSPRTDETNDGSIAAGSAQKASASGSDKASASSSKPSAGSKSATR
ncbi:MAG: polymer-forming cytoskeletal protein [Gemmatimonadota bacterium]|nr:polymer-forming cytoskeletal protein [Gemmatimonadota bacterium]